MTKTLLLLAGILTALPLAACRISVDKDEHSNKADVDIRTPLGNVAVRTNVDAPDTGLAVFPGARPLRDEHEPGSADVNVGNSFFGVKVIATKFESEERPDQIAGYYKNEMKPYGEVLECHGDIDFRNRAGLRQPFCKEKPRSRDIQLVAGVENRHRIVVIKPRGDGSEFSVVFVETRGQS